MNMPKIRKLYYSSQEVCELARIHLHELRNWETSFSFLRPIKKKSGRKLYRPQDLHVILTIKRLKNAGYSADQILDVFKDIQPGRITEAEQKMHSFTYGNEFFKEVSSSLKEILNLLENK